VLVQVYVFIVLSFFTVFIFLITASAFEWWSLDYLFATAIYFIMYASMSFCLIFVEFKNASIFSTQQPNKCNWIKAMNTCFPSRRLHECIVYINYWCYDHRNRNRFLTENRIDSKSYFSCIPSNDLSIEALDHL